MMPSLPQILLVLLLVLLLFGAGKLPKVMGDLGKGMRNFRDGLKSDEKDEDETKHLKDDSGSSK